MIKTFSVYGLHGRDDFRLDIDLHKDINIFTGKNGSGKTTILKLLWYMISPNVERTVREIDFNDAQVSTDEFTLTIARKKGKVGNEVNIVFEEPQNKPFEVKLMADEFLESRPLEKVEEINAKINMLPSASVFFPTFRRIEGGFAIGEKSYNITYTQRITSTLTDAISSYANMMSVKRHLFVASISTEDIEQLLTRKYADVSERTNKLHVEFSKYLSNTILPIKRKSKKQKSKFDIKELFQAYEILDNILNKQAEIDAKRKNFMNSFDVLSKLISSIFKDKGISVSSNLTFGEAKQAIRAGILSAGEKQMLSFLCYNAFNEKCPIFIDEPELSLHGDWQRILIPTLLAQGTSNQFILSTHSPFIYAKYPEKEICLQVDRGE